jgi:hypothetical protein
MVPALAAILPPAAVLSAFGCSSGADCNMAGVCTLGVCVCDPGWRHGPGLACEHLDLVPQRSPSDGAAWPPHGGRSSTNSSWCIASHREAGGAGTPDTFHIFVSELSPGCGLSTWLPGSHIIHATVST